MQKQIHEVDCNDVLAMLLRMTNSCKWAAMAPTVRYLQKKYIQDIDVELFAPVSESIGCKRHLSCLGCAGSSRIFAFKVLQEAAQQR